MPSHNHRHSQNRFAVIPTSLRMDADPDYSGEGVTIAFLDSGFCRHPDLVEPKDRIAAFVDVTGETNSIVTSGEVESWRWHGTQTSVVAAGNGWLSDGIYQGIASKANVVLVKVSDHGRITEDNIARGIEWVVANREKYNIRVLNISLGGDNDVACSTSIIDQAAEEAVKKGIVVVVAAGNSDGTHSIPPANAPSVITVGGFDDNNELNARRYSLYHSNFGETADGTVKPEIIAPAMWVAAPIPPETPFYERAEALSKVVTSPDYQLFTLAQGITTHLTFSDAASIRRFAEDRLRDDKIIAEHYQHVDGTSFAAPIVSSIVAQMIEANPRLTPGAIKNILTSTARRIAAAPAIRQGFGIVDARQAVSLAKTETHELNIAGCKPPRMRKGQVLFVFHDDNAHTVGVAGDFNEWNPLATPLSRDKTGLWLGEIESPKAGRYQYKYVIDSDRWIEDPSNGFRVPDNYGGLNSLLVIE